MTCERCRGLMLRDLLDKHDSGLRWLWGWRCVCCGNWVDSIVHQKRQAQSRLGESVRVPREGQRRRAPSPEEVEQDSRPPSRRFWVPADREGSSSDNTGDVW